MLALLWEALSFCVCVAGRLWAVLTKSTIAGMKLARAVRVTVSHKISRQNVRFYMTEKSVSQLLFVHMMKMCGLSKEC